MFLRRFCVEHISFPILVPAVSTVRQVAFILKIPIFKLPTFPSQFLVQKVQNRQESTVTPINPFNTFHLYIFYHQYLCLRYFPDIGSHDVLFTRCTSAGIDDMRLVQHQPFEVRICATLVIGDW